VLTIVEAGIMLDLVFPPENELHSDEEMFQAFVIRIKRNRHYSVKVFSRGSSLRHLW
jgi:hypothetical protein